MAENSSSSGNDHSDTTSLTSVSSPGIQETTEAYLERISAKLALAWEGALGPQSADFMRLHMAPDFTNQAINFHDNPFPYADNLEEHIAALDALRKANPDWRTACFNFTASVHQESGHAVVWFTSGATGKPGNTPAGTTNRESASKMYWRTKETDPTQWECYSHECIRGGGEVD